MGKGRTVVGLIYENAARGRRKSLWISISADLIHDARRDMRGCLGADDSVTGPVAGELAVHALKGLKPEATLGLGMEGVLFMSYRLLCTRLDQVVLWCGGDKFDGCVILDEFHRGASPLVSPVLFFTERIPLCQIDLTNTSPSLDNSTRHHITGTR